MQKDAKLKEALHKAISVNLRTNSKISCALLLAGGDSSEVARCSQAPDFFIAV